MDAIDCIMSRRSVRKFLPKPVSEEIIEKIIKAGTQAPSAGNEQPWQFIVLKDKKALAEVAKISPYTQMAPDAAFAIIICGDLRLETHKGYWVQDISACTQNILLAAHALGLGGVWTGIYPREDRVKALQQEFEIPHEVIPMAIVPIGYPAEIKKPEQRYMKVRVHYEKW